MALALLAALAPSCEPKMDPLAYNERLTALQASAYAIDNQMHGQFETRFWSDSLQPDNPEFLALLDQHRQSYLLVLDSIEELSCPCDSAEFREGLATLGRFLLAGLDNYYLALARDKDALDSVQRAYNLRYQTLEEEFIRSQERFAKDNGLTLQ